VLPDGDAILLGDLDCDATVLRIDRTTGAVVWRTEVLTVPYECRAPIPGLESSPPPLAVEGDDAVVFALGGLVVKLDAAAITSPPAVIATASAASSPSVWTTATRAATSPSCASAAAPVPCSGDTRSTGPDSSSTAPTT
jgi:hypothetical protein